MMTAGTAVDSRGGVTFLVLLFCNGVGEAFAIALSKRVENVRRR